MPKPPKADASPAAPAGDRLEIRYVPLDTVALWDENPKAHDELGIAESILRHGFRDAPIYDAALGALVAGNGRTHVLRELRDGRNPPPRGIAVDADGGWLVPVQFGVDAASRDAARSFAIDHNNLTLGGQLGAFEVARIWDEGGYKAILQSLHDAGLPPISVPEEQFRLLTEGVPFPDVPEGKQGTPAATITIRVENPPAVEDVAAAIRPILESHPEWMARVTR